MALPWVTIRISGLSVDSVSGEPTRLAVSWDAVEGAAKYSVRWKTGSSAWGNAVETTANSYTVTGLSPGTTYSVQVGALAGGATLTPSATLGLRHDGGDAETGTGMELGADLGYAAPSRGLDMALRVHGLAAHADKGYGEWGVSGSLLLVPGGAGRGLSLTLSPTWGNAANDAGTLWSAREARRQNEQHGARTPCGACRMHPPQIGTRSSGGPKPIRPSGNWSRPSVGRRVGRRGTARTVPGHVATA